VGTKSKRDLEMQRTSNETRPEDYSVRGSEELAKKRNKSRVKEEELRKKYLFSVSNSSCSG
jgi:hypothetical protein